MLSLRIIQSWYKIWSSAWWRDYFFEFCDTAANHFLFKILPVRVKQNEDLRAQKLQFPIDHNKDQKYPVLSLDLGFTGVLFGGGVAACFKNAYGTYSKLQLYRKIILKPLIFF